MWGTILKDFLNLSLFKIYNNPNYLLKDIDNGGTTKSQQANNSMRPLFDTINLKTT